MRIRSTLSTLLAAVLLAGVANAAHAQAREQGRLLIASEVLEEIRDSRDQSIPERLLQRAYAIAVIPDLTKVAFFAGGRRVHGVLVLLAQPRRVRRARAGWQRADHRRQGERRSLQATRNHGQRHPRRQRDDERRVRTALPRRGDRERRRTAHRAPTLGVRGPCTGRAEAAGQAGTGQREVVPALRPEAGRGAEVAATGSALGARGHRHRCGGGGAGWLRRRYESAPELAPQQREAGQGL